MDASLVVNLMGFYGIFLFGCAIGAFAFIGTKAKTALMSGGMSGTIAIIIAFCVHTRIKGFTMAGPFLCLVLFCVFAWRSYKSLAGLIELMELKGEAMAIRSKAIAFLIISLMAVMSIVLAGILFALVL